MAAFYLLDTNTVSYIIKGNIPGVRERLQRVPMAQIAISAVTEAEIRFGVARLPNAVRLKKLVEEFLLRVDVLAWDSQAAQQYALIRATLDRDGKPMSNLDMMIAAQALSADAVLVTNDRVFKTVKHLKLEDWTRA